MFSMFSIYIFIYLDLATRFKTFISWLDDREIEAILKRKRIYGTNVKMQFIKQIIDCLPSDLLEKHVDRLSKRSHKLRINNALDSKEKLKRLITAQYWYFRHRKGRCSSCELYLRLQDIKCYFCGLCCVNNEFSYLTAY